MFSGIVEAQGRIEGAADRGAVRAVRIGLPPRWKLRPGESVSVDGICSTVRRVRGRSFEVEYVAETLGKTAAGTLRRGGTVNLERSLRVGGRLDGHFVQGHVDGVGVVAGMDGKLLTIDVPRPLARYLAERGSVAVNGVALTVARLRASRFTVALIPHTLASTNLGVLRRGARVNVETDLIARHLARLLKAG